MCMLIHYMYVDIFFPPSKAIPIIFEHVNTHYQTLQTWIGYNATHYHNLTHYHMRYHTFFSQFCMVCSYLQRVAECYCQIYRK